MAKMLKNLEVSFVSFVNKGANKRPFYFAKSKEKQDERDDLTVEIKLIKTENPQKLLYGVVYEPDVEDAHGHLAEQEEIEKACHKFMADYRNMDKHHNLQGGAGVPVESYIAPLDMEIGEQTIKKGSWVLVSKASDEVWEQYIQGEINGYSLFGKAYLEEVKEDNMRDELKKKLEEKDCVVVKNDDGSYLIKTKEEEPAKKEEVNDETNQEKSEQEESVGEVKKEEEVQSETVEDNNDAKKLVKKFEEIVQEQFKTVMDRIDEVENKMQKSNDAIGSISKALEETEGVSVKNTKNIITVEKSIFDK